MDIQRKEKLRKVQDARAKRLLLPLLLVVLVAMALFLALRQAQMAGATDLTVLTVSGTRGTLELSLDEEPTDNNVSYYMAGHSGELTTTVQWLESTGIWTVTVNTRDWTAFKVADGIYTPTVTSPFWQDAAPDDTGWVERSIFTPTISVSGNFDAVLTAWGIWGDEDLEYWQLGQQHVLTDSWSLIAPDTYQIALDSQSIEALKVATWPDLLLQDSDPYWVTGSAPGWVVHTPMPFRLFFAFIGK